MPFVSEAQRKKFYSLHSEGKISDATLKHWEAETGDRKLPERLHPKKTASVDFAKIASMYTIDEILEFEKEANLLQVGKNVGKSVLNAGRWAGEGVVNALGGGRGGITHQQILEPLMAAKPSAVAKWDPLAGFKDLGKVRQTHTEGPFKGMFKYEGGERAFENANPTFMERLKNMPRYMWQSAKGERPTAGDYLLNRMAGEKNLDPAKMWAHLQKNPAEMAKFKKTMTEVNQLSPWQLLTHPEHGAWARRYYGLKGTWQGMTFGIPAYDIASSALGKGNPENTAPENVGELIGSNVGMFGAWPLGLGGALTASYAGGRLGKMVGGGVAKLTGAKKAPQYMQETFGSPPASYPQALPEPVAEHKRRLLAQYGISV